MLDQPEPSESPETEANETEEDGGASSTGNGDAIREPTSSMVLAEVLPGIAVVFGEVPDALRLDLVDFGIVPDADRKQISTYLGSIGSVSTAVGNLGQIAGASNAVAPVAQGLYRLSAETQALLDSGATLAVKDGMNLGTVLHNGIAGQARFIPVSEITAAGAVAPTAAVTGAATALQVAAAIGPALAMVALQMQLSQIQGLVGRNIALTSQVLTTIRGEQWSELTGIVKAVDSTLEHARELGSVPASLWETVAGNKADLEKQLDLYRTNVVNHIQQLDRLDIHRRREYLDNNAEAIVFDAHALMSSLKAWTTYQALHAGKARTAGADDPDEARLVDLIARTTREQFDSALVDATRLVDALTRELHLVADLPGGGIRFTKKRKDAKASRHTSGELLKAIEPLADHLRRPAPPLETPSVVCSLADLTLDPYLRALRWIVDDKETLLALAFPYQLSEGDVLRSLGQSTLGRRDPEKWATLVAVTDRRVITARASGFLQDGRTDREIPTDQVRYVRARNHRGEGVRSTIDLITRDADLRWAFHADTDTSMVDEFAAVLAESMAIPDSERAALTEMRRALVSGPEPRAQSPEPRAQRDRGCGAEPVGIARTAK